MILLTDFTVMQFASLFDGKTTGTYIMRNYQSTVVRIHKIK